MHKNQQELEKRPMISFFMKPSPFIELYEADEEFSSNSHWDDSLCLSLTDDGLPLWAALSKTPPTTCTTPGKTRPSGYSKAGKWLPSKWIASKTDKRAGK